MCHGWPQLRLEQLNPIVYFGVSLVLDKTCSNDATTYALKCLADITGGGIAGSQAVSGVGAYPLTQRLIQILSQRKSNDQVDPALRTLRNICDHVQGYDPVQAAVKAGFLDVAHSFLELGLSKAAELDMCYLLCKVACGKQTISQLIIHPSVLSNLIGIAMEGNREWPVRKQAMQAICHVADTTDDVVIEALVKCNGIEAFVEALFIRADDRVVMKALKAIEKILEVGERLGHPYGLMIDQFCGIDRIEVLQNHANSDVAVLAEEILDRYMGENEAEDDQVRHHEFPPECYKFDEVCFGTDCSTGN